MMTASLCAGVVLLWAFAAPCNCTMCSSAAANSSVVALGGKARTADASIEFPGSAPDLGDPRIGANMVGGKLALPPPERLVVAARHQEDILWMHEDLVDLPYLVYQDGDPSAPLRVPAGGPGTGKEPGCTGVACACLLIHSFRNCSSYSM